MLIARSISVLVVVAALVAIPVGCGDDGDDSATTLETSSLTKAEFVKRANAICNESIADVGKQLEDYLVDRQNSKKGADELAADALRAIALPAIETQLEEIEELGAPDGEQKEIEAFLTAQQRSVEQLEQRQNVSLSTDLEPAFRQAGKLARQYGLSSCDFS